MLVAVPLVDTHQPRHLRRAPMETPLRHTGLLLCALSPDASTRPEDTVNDGRKYCSQGCSRQVQLAGMCRSCAAVKRSQERRNPLLRSGWRKSAACFGTVDPRIFPAVPPEGRFSAATIVQDRNSFIREYCRRCPVRKDCRLEGLSMAAEYGVAMYGVWGGTDFTRRTRESKRDWCERVGVKEEVL